MAAPTGVDVAMARCKGGDVSQKLASVQHMAIQIDSCSARETIVVTTRSSVYELIVLRPTHGLILVRGGRHFPKCRRALFLGSAADGGPVEPRIIGIGLRMRLVCGDRSFLTSAVQSIGRRPASAASTACAQSNEPRVPRDSHGSPTILGVA